MNSLAAIALAEAATHTPHRLHASERLWPETNCYIDLWVELLHAVGVDPMASLACTASCGFDGEQWDFIKIPPEDLRFAYGIEVSEINVWRSVEEHVTTHLGLGHLLTVECDAMFLPDTAGVTYGSEHQKTTIAPLMIDVAARRLAYLHNSGCYELCGDDYDGVLRSGSAWSPYIERIDLSALARPDLRASRSIASELLDEHLARRPLANPVRQMAERIALDTAWLQASPPETFHRYAFGTLRQCGAWAELLADFVTWLRPDEVQPCAASLRELSAGAKTCQFKLARVASGRAGDLSGLFETMAEHWEDAYRTLGR